MTLSKALKAAILAMCISSPAAAQMSKYEPDPDLGFQVASRLCVSCHEVDGRHPATRIADVPSFKAIANKPGQSASRLTRAMIDPHPPMVDVSLTREEVDDVVAYILSLKSGD